MASTDDPLPEERERQPIKPTKIEREGKAPQPVRTVTLRLKNVKLDDIEAILDTLGLNRNVSTLATAYYKGDLRAEIKKPSEVHDLMDPGRIRSFVGQTLFNDSSKLRYIVGDTGLILETADIGTEPPNQAYLTIDRLLHRMHQLGFDTAKRRDRPNASRLVAQTTIPLWGAIASALILVSTGILARYGDPFKAQYLIYGTIGIGFVMMGLSVLYYNWATGYSRNWLQTKLRPSFDPYKIWSMVIAVAGLLVAVLTLLL